MPCSTSLLQPRTWTCMCSRVQVHACTHTHRHTHSTLPPTLSPTLSTGQTARNFLKCLSGHVPILQVCFSSSRIPAREIQNHDPYSEHKHYFNLVAPVQAGTGADSPCKCQGEVRTQKIQERNRGIECDSSKEMAPSQPQTHLTSFSLSLQRVVCTAGLKWYPHPALIHCVKGCEVSSSKWSHYGYPSYC